MAAALAESDRRRGIEEACDIEHDNVDHEAVEYETMVAPLGGALQVLAGEWCVEARVHGDAYGEVEKADDDPTPAVNPDDVTPASSTENMTGEHIGNQQQGWIHHRQGCACVVLPSSTIQSPRRTFWTAASTCFHPSVLSCPTPTQGAPIVREALQRVFVTLQPLLFSCRRADVPRYVDPPVEMFQAIEFPEFLQQYVRLCENFIPALLREPSGAECMRVTAVQVAFGQVEVMNVSPSKLVLVAEQAQDTDWFDASLRLGRPSCIGHDVHIETPGHPRASRIGRIIGFVTEVVEQKLYKLLMTCPYQQVRDCGVWHILRAYHRLIMSGSTSEALAETACSALTLQVRGCFGRKPILGDLMNAARLRTSGVCGNGQDMNFISRSLDIFFRGKPWHVLVSTRTLQQRAASHRWHTRWVSRAVERYRASVIVGARFTWLADGLRPLAVNCARTSLSVVVDAGSGTREARAELIRNPKAGLVLRR